MRISFIQATALSATMFHAALLAPACHTAKADVPANTTPLTVRRNVVTLRTANAESTLELPFVEGGDPTVAARINAYFEPHVVLGLPTQEIEEAFARCGCGIVGSRFEIDFQRGSVLGVSLEVDILDGDSDSVYVARNFDVETGRLLTITDVFRPDKIRNVAARVRSELDAYIEDQHLASYAARTGLSFADVTNYALDDNGIRFWQQRAAPTDAEPSGVVRQSTHLTWAQLKPFLTQRFAAFANE